MKLNVNLSDLKVPREQLYYYLIGGNVLILLLVGFFVLRPVMGLLGKHATEITRTKGEVAALKEKTRTLREMEDTLPATRAVYRPVIKNAPKTKDVAGYQTELEDLADLTKLDLVTVDTSGGTGAGSPGTPTAPASSAGKLTVGGFPAFPVSIQVTGTYANILDFMNRLETMDRFTRVTGITFATSGDSGEVDATISAQAIYLGSPS